MKMTVLLRITPIAQMLLGSVWACTCAPALPPLKALAQADAVFSGEVILIEEREFERGDGLKIVAARIADVVVSKSWKGGVSGTIKVHTGGGMGDCGYPFKKGESYLFYAARGDDGRLETNICMRTSYLRNARTEILELEGRLPKPIDPAAPPKVTLIGKIDDAGYEGLIFVIHNRLHERIFLFLGSTGGHLVQVYKANAWVSYAPNSGVSRREELSQDEASKEFERWKQSYEGMGTKRSATYLDPDSTATKFIAVPTENKAWRVGLQYITESELDDGKEVQESHRYIWSDAIVPTKLDVPKRTFGQAFEHEAQAEPDAGGKRE